MDSTDADVDSTQRCGLKSTVDISDRYNANLVEKQGLI